MTNDDTFSIGELSRRSGVAVKTIRHYADEGILPPSALSDAGYRRYAPPDERRLATIRSLRALGFSIPAIGAMLDERADPIEVAALQLDVVEAQMRALERQRAMLRAASTLREPTEVVRHLEAAHAAASLGAAERANRLERWLARTQPPAASTAAGAAIRAMILDDLPVDLTATQLEAWIRLSRLLDDEELLETLRLQREPFGESVTAEAREAFGREMMALYGRLYPLVAEGAAPGDARVRALAGDWVALFAKVLDRADDPAFRRWLLDFSKRTNDPRIERFWNDVAALRGRPAMPSMTAALSLLTGGLERIMEEHPDA